MNRIPIDIAPRMAGATLRPPLWMRTAVVLLAAWLPFLPSLNNPWLWDDALLLAQRLAPDQLAGFADVWRQPYWGHVGPADTYRPLSLSLIYLEKLTFGPAVLPYHLVSLLLHSAVSLLVLALFGRLAGARVGWLCAVLFAVHPIHAEAVAMVYGQLELCSALFTLAAIWFYICARHTLNVSDGPHPSPLPVGEGASMLRPLPFALAWVLAFCAACSKESGLMLPALLLLVRAVWLVGDGDLSSRVRRFRQGLGWDALFLLPVPAYLLLRLHALNTLAPNAEATVTMGYSVGERLKTIVVSVGHALRLTTVPSGQTLYYGHLRDAVFGWPVDELVWIVCAAAVLVWLGGRLGRWPVLFGAAWFGLVLLPVANIIPTGVLVAERTLYLPSLGVCFLLATLAVRYGDGWRRCILPALTLAYAVLAAVVVSQWRDEETLWRSTVAAHPRSPMGQMSLGVAMIKRWRESATVPDAEELHIAADAFAAAYALNPELKEALVGSAFVAEIQRTGQLPLVTP